LLKTLSTRAVILPVKVLFLLVAPSPLREFFEPPPPSYIDKSVRLGPVWNAPPIFAFVSASLLVVVFALLAPADDSATIMVTMSFT